MKQTPIERLLDAQIGVSYAGTQSVSECLSDTFEQEIKEYEKCAIAIAFNEGVRSATNGCTEINTGTEYYEKTFGKTDDKPLQSENTQVMDGVNFKDGHITVPEEVAAELREHYLCKKGMDKDEPTMHDVGNYAQLPNVSINQKETTFTADEILRGMWFVLSKKGAVHVNDTELLVFGKLSAMLQEMIKDKQI